MSNVTGNVTWIKLNVDIFDVGKLPVIASMQDGAMLELLWVKLLVLAGQSNCDGNLFVGNSIPFDKKTLAIRLKIKEKMMEKALEIFKNFGMIGEENGIFFIKNWAKYQNVDEMGRVREQTRRRVSAYRERQKTAENATEGNVTGNVTVTLCNATEEKRREENKNNNQKEIDKEKGEDDLSFLDEKPKKPKVNLNGVLDSYNVQGELRDSMVDFINMRRAKKKPLTERALKMVLNELNRLSADTLTQIKIVNQSVLHTWDSVYALKDETTFPRMIRSVDDVTMIGKNGIEVSAIPSTDLDSVF